MRRMGQRCIPAPFTERWLKQGLLERQSVIMHTALKSVLTSIQITKAAKERDDDKRTEYGVRIGKYLPHERVYIDESRFDRRTSTRTRAWAFRGERAFSKVFFLRGKRLVIY